MAVNNRQGEATTDKNVILRPGINDAITDVEGVSVGHVTVVEDDVRTGITVVNPLPLDEENALLVYGKYSDGSRSELTGFQVIDDFGLLSAPIFMTNLMSVGKVYNGALTYAFSRGSGLPTEGGWPPIIMGFDDRALNNMTRRVLTEEHALKALENATFGPVPQGNTGAGAGAVSFGFKGGIGTASRIVRIGQTSYTIGSLVLANYGRSIEFGTELISSPVENPFPSMLCVVATDAPLSPHSMNSLAAFAARGAEDIGAGRRPRGSYSVVSFSTGHRFRSPDDGNRYTLRSEEGESVWELAHGARLATRASVVKALSAAESVRNSEGGMVSKVPEGVINEMDR